MLLFPTLSCIGQVIPGTKLLTLSDAQSVSRDGKTETTHAIVTIMLFSPTLSCIGQVIPGTKLLTLSDAQSC